MRLEYLPDSKVPSGDYWLRGGICWPGLQPRGMDHGLRGFAVMCGQLLETKVIYVFRQADFWTVDPVLGGDNALPTQGLAVWLNHSWADLFADTYFWHQPQETHRKYLLQILRSPMVQPKPHFIEVDWSKLEQAHPTLWETLQAQRLKFSTESELHRQLRQFQAQTYETPPAVYALCCCLMGYDRYPYRAPISQEERGRLRT